jgi:hypothetical protein
VKIDLLIEVVIRGWTLVAAGIAGIEKARAIGHPGNIAAGRAAVDVSDALMHRLARGHIVDDHVAALVAALRQGYRDQRAIGRGHEPVDGRVAAGIYDQGVDDHPGGVALCDRVRVCGHVHDHEHGLLARRLALDGKQLVAADHRSPVADGGRG